MDLRPDNEEEQFCESATVEFLVQIIPGFRSAARLSCVRKPGRTTAVRRKVSPKATASAPAAPCRGKSHRRVLGSAAYSGRQDLNLRLRGPKPRALARLSYAPSMGHLT